MCHWHLQGPLKDQQGTAESYLLRSISTSASDYCCCRMIASVNAKQVEMCCLGPTRTAALILSELQSMELQSVDYPNINYCEACSVHVTVYKMQDKMQIVWWDTVCLPAAIVWLKYNAHGNNTLTISITLTMNQGMKHALVISSNTYESIWVVAASFSTKSEWSCFAWCAEGCWYIDKTPPVLLTPVHLEELLNGWFNGLKCLLWCKPFSLQLWSDKIYFALVSPVRLRLNLI